MNGTLNDLFFVAKYGQKEIDNHAVNVNGHNKRIIRSVGAGANGKSSTKICTDAVEIEVRDENLDVYIIGRAHDAPLGECHATNDCVAVAVLFENADCSTKRGFNSFSMPFSPRFEFMNSVIITR